MLISFAVTICVFVFTYAKCRFSHDAAHITVCSQCKFCLWVVNDWLDSLSLARGAFQDGTSDVTLCVAYLVSVSVLFNLLDDFS